MKRKKLSNLMLRNYVLVYFIMTFVSIISMIVIMSLAFHYYIRIKSIEEIDKLSFQSASLMKDDYKNIDTSELLNRNGFMIVIDGSSYKVLYSKGPVPKKLDKYTKEEYNKMLIEQRLDDSDYMYSFAYNKNKDFLLVTAVPFIDFFRSFLKDSHLKPTTFFYLALSFYISVFLFSMILYSRITSKTFTMPLKKLMDGVKSLAKGNYSARINLKAENEFGELSDAFNFMAEEIEEEKNLKEKSEEMKRRIIMDISHDLKNPLASVIGYSDFLIKNSDIKEDERTKYLKVIQKNSERANTLISDLFELSKIQSTDFRMNLKSHDICEFLRETIAGYIPDMEEKGIEYFFDIPSKSVHTLIDEKNMDRAIGNLILNSIKYNPNSTKLNIILKDLEESIDIIIRDNGIGIPKELSKKIFEPFFRVDSSRNSESGGTGLGLAITKSIIKKHNGSINLNSDINKGCEFIIKLKKI